MGSDRASLGDEPKAQGAKLKETLTLGPVQVQGQLLSVSPETT